MQFLICSDGTEAADKPVQLGAFLAGPAGAEVTLLGIAEAEPRDGQVQDTLAAQAALLRAAGVEPEIVTRTGEPIDEILEQTRQAKYDLVIIGARGKGRGGARRRSQRTYALVKAIGPPVLVATGECEHLAKVLICTGGKRYIQSAVELTGKLAAAAGAAVTLLHVMAEPPAMYTAFSPGKEDVEQVLASGSELGRNLRGQKELLEKLGVPTEVRVRHGVVIDEVFKELRNGEHDMIVTGSAQARGAFRDYIMGDLTRAILNRTERPVLVGRPGEGSGFWATIKRMFSGPSDSE